MYSLLGSASYELSKSSFISYSTILNFGKISLNKFLKVDFTFSLDFNKDILFLGFDGLVSVWLKWLFSNGFLVSFWSFLPEKTFENSVLNVSFGFDLLE